MIRGEELLAAREDELRRALRLAGDGGDVRLEVEAALAAEAATEMRDDDADLVLRELEGLGDTGAGRERHLRGGPDGDLLAMPFGDDGARLDRRGVRHVGDVALADDVVGGGEAGLDIAVDDRRMARVVAVAHDVVVVGVRLPIGVHQRGARLERGLDVVDDGHRLDVDLDQVARALGDLVRDRGDTGDDIALEVDVLLREQAAVVDVLAEAGIGNVGVGDDREHARQCLRLGRVDARDAPAGDAGVAELAVGQTRQLEVAGVAASPGHLVLAVLALERPVLDRGHAAPPSLSNRE